jgi:hypothetical protein
MKQSGMRSPAVIADFYMSGVPLATLCLLFGPLAIWASDKRAGIDSLVIVGFFMFSAPVLAFFWPAILIGLAGYALHRKVHCQ